MKTFKIKKGIKYPEKFPNSVKAKATLDAMEVEDSVLIEDEILRRCFASRITTLHVTTDKRFKSKTVEKNKAWRFWRLK